MIQSIRLEHSLCNSVENVHGFIFCSNLKSMTIYRNSMDNPDASQLPNLIKEWVQIDADLETLSAEVREKRKRSAMVRSMILGIMKAGQIGKLNISAGAVVARSTPVKAAMSKKYISSALVDFFGGDKIKADTCAAYLEENRPVKNKDKLTLEPKS